MERSASTLATKPTIIQIKAYAAQMRTSLGERFEDIVDLGSKMSLDSAVALAHTLAAYLDLTDTQAEPSS